MTVRPKPLATRCLCSVVVLCLLIVLLLSAVGADLRDCKGFSHCPIDKSLYENLPIEGGIWPLPQKFSYGASNRTIRRDGITFVFCGVRDVDCDILRFARDTYVKKWFFPTRQIGKVGGSLNVVVRLHKRCPTPRQYPQQNMSEAYTLRVPAVGDATLEAEEVWGILRGLETLSQMIYYKKDSYFIRTANIQDWPEYPVRGLLIDTSRHYLRKNVILRQIDLLAQNKMNLLHWHIIDMNSFPYVSKVFPNLSKAGAFSPQHVYSPNTVAEIINYGRLRGVRVMVEVDTPGHMGSWIGQKGLLAKCFDSEGKPTDPALIDPTQEKNYEFLEAFLKEIFSTFAEKFFHLGGDESFYWTQNCWENNPQIRQFMANHNIANSSELEHYYISKLQQVVNGLINDDPSRRPIFWEEVFAFKPEKNAIIHIWRGREDADLADVIANTTAAGYQVIVSACWYLDYICYGSDWRCGSHNYYHCDPRHFNGTEEQKRAVLGGVAAIWGEYVDGTNLEARTWPRASAVAERLWSPPERTQNAVKAIPRMHEHRCRLIARGYRAEPSDGPDYCSVEYDNDLPSASKDIRLFL